MRPRFVLQVNDAPLGGPVKKALQALTVTDREGARADSLEIEIADAGPPFFAVPDSAAVFRVWGGYRPAGAADDADALSYFGAFTDAEITLRCLPYAIRLTAASADLKSSVKSQQERHFDGQTVGEVFAALAAENNLAAQIDPKIGAARFPQDWVAMQNESLLHFGERIARRHGALFALKDGKLLLAERGAGRTPGGRAPPALVIQPEDVLEGSLSVTFSGREKAGSVRAEYADREAATRGSATAGAGAPSHTLREVHGDPADAARAAEAKRRQLNAAADTTQVAVVGNPKARAGGVLRYARVRPQIDGVDWIIEEARHRFDKDGGYVTEISAKRKSA